MQNEVKASYTAFDGMFIQVSKDLMEITDDWCKIEISHYHVHNTIIPALKTELKEEIKRLKKEIIQTILEVLVTD